MLESLAPTLLALTAATFLRRPLQVVALSLLINVGICATMVTCDYGRLKTFDDHLLDVSLPAIPGLDHYLVLMAGDEATGYIATQFPATTRFARVFANFYRPTFNPELDGIVRSFLSKYDVSRMLAYVSEPENIQLMRSTLQYFGLQLAEGHRWDLGGRRRPHGFLYNVAAIPEPGQDERIIQKTPASVRPGVGQRRIREPYDLAFDLPEANLVGGEKRYTTASIRMLELRELDKGTTYEAYEYGDLRPLTEV